MGRLANVAIALLVPLLVVLHLLIAPYTKIEESFTIQAIHDFLTYGIPYNGTAEYLDSHYDHLKYPELHPVPRSFVAPASLAAVAWPLAWLVHGEERQVLVRAILGLYNAFSILAFRNALAKAFGTVTANWYILLQASQFHVMFYASRTLPNFVPFGLAVLALRLFVASSSSQPTAARALSIKRGLTILTILGIVFRSEIALLLATHTFWFFLVRRRLGMRDVISAGVSGVAIGLALTIPIDTALWRQPQWLLGSICWPELVGFVFNVVHGRSIEWGSHPWHLYWTSVLPRLLLNPFALLVCTTLALASPALRERCLDLLAPNIAFIALYSLQPHKELRFIVYAVPPLTAVMAAGAAWIWIRRHKSRLTHVLSLMLLASTLVCYAVSLTGLLVSSLNYPGAFTINRLHEIAKDHIPEPAEGTVQTVNVHIDVLTAQTGATLFLQHPPKIDYPNGTVRSTTWRYDKTNDKSGDGTALRRPDFWAQFDFALAEQPEKVIGVWDMLDSVEGFAGLRLIRPGTPWNQPRDFDTSESEEGATRELRKSRRLPSWYQAFRAIWYKIGSWVRTNVSRGWWIDIRMEPLIHILKRREAFSHTY